MKVAIVSGASSGVGREFVKQICKKENLDVVWIIARREDRLRKIAEDFPGRVRPLPLDLTDSKNILFLKNLLKEEKPDVWMLVNAAGFGKMGNYAEIPLQDCYDMIDLNCRALVAMTQIILPYMKKGARILQICSSSAFQPLPALNVYAATKAFVHSYSRALRWELFGKGIHVTAVCPYWIKDTEFISVAKDTNRKAIRHFPLASYTRPVVKLALWSSRLNLPVSTPGLISLVQRITAKVIPREIIIACWQALRRL